MPGGGVDVRKLQEYTLHRAERCRRRISAILSAIHPNDECSHEFSDQEHVEHNGCDGQTQEKKTRTRRTIMSRRTEDGELQVLSPKETIWWLYYVANSLLLEDSHHQNKFRSRFRLPYQNYLELVAECKKEIHAQYFGRWQQRPSGTRGRKPHPIELLVLGTLRYLGRGWTFDDLEEATAISGEVHREFCHSFIDFGSTVLFKKHVIAPINYAEAKRHMAEFSEAGLDGAVGSTDCTNVVTEGCEFNLHNQHLNQKSSHTSRTFSLTANHRKRILHLTRGGPSRWNDQMMVRFDEFVSGIWEGKVLKDVKFQLYERDIHGNVIAVQYSGGYVICDNGYLRWSVLVPPFKVTNLETEIRWSKWVESMRKDVEDTFGILKG